MSKIIRPEKERYNWLGCVASLIVSLAPWLFFHLIRQSGGDLPWEEFNKFLLGANLIAALILAMALWSNLCSWNFRRKRQQFFDAARHTPGTILEARRVHATRSYRITTGKEQSPHVYWQLRVHYRDECTGELREVFSELFLNDPLKSVADRTISVYYTQDQVMVGDLVVHKI